jgi:hypothetical protein
MYRTRRRRARERIVEIPDERLAEYECAHHRVRERLIALGLAKNVYPGPDPHPWHAGLRSCPDRDGQRWSRELRQWVGS